MSLFLNAIVSGIALGSIYSLLGLAYTVVHKSTGIFNIAQGDLMMVGILISYYLLEQQHWPQEAVFLAVTIAVGMLALLEERWIIRRYLSRASDSLGWFASSLAFSVIIETLCVQIYGDNPPRAIRSPLPKRALHLGGVYVSYQLLLLLAAMIAITIGLELFYRQSGTGIAMRASAEDRQAAALRGIDPTMVSRLGFGIAGLIGGMTAFICGPVISADPTIGLTYGFKGFVALAIGGFGSIRGAVLGGVMVGIAEQVLDLYGSSSYEILASLGLLVVVLSIRPEGVFASRSVRRV